MLVARTPRWQAPAAASSYPQYIKVWFDWNRDTDFNDAGEGYDINTNTTSNGPHSITVNVPVTASVGATRMRIVNNGDNDADQNPPEPPNSGSTLFYGEAEDYTINVQPLLTNSIAPSSVQTINLAVNGTALTVTETPAANSRQWKYGTIAGGPYSTNIGGATGASYTPNFASNGTYYIVCVSTKGGLTATSNEVRVNVVTSPTITSADNASFQIGSAGSFSVTTSGYPTGASMLISEGRQPALRRDFYQSRKWHGFIGRHPHGRIGGELTPSQ